MKEEAQKIAQSMPEGYTHLVKDIVAKGYDGSDSCNVTDFTTLMDKYKFPSEIQNQFRIVTFSESVEFQAFHVSINNSYADIQEFIGAGINQNGVIKIAFLQVLSQGTPIQQYKQHKCCHRCWLVGRCCHSCSDRVAMTSSQMNTITDALRATAPPASWGNYTNEVEEFKSKSYWDILMNSYSTNCLLKDEDCTKDFLKTQYQCKNKDIDEQMCCVIDKIRFDGNETSCYLSLCSSFYQDKKYPKSNQLCKERYFQNYNIF